jgi:hypothetical protein
VISSSLAVASSAASKNDLLGHVAVDDGIISLLAFNHPLVVDFHDDKGNLQLLQDLGDMLADPAAAGNDNMIGQPFLGEILGLQRFMLKEMAFDPVQRGCQAGNKGGQDHADNGGRQDQGVDPGIDGIGFQPDPGENKGKFTDLEKTETQGQGDDVPVAGTARQGWKK